MVVSMQGARVCNGVVALAVVAAVAGGCRARPLAADSGTISFDAGGAVDATVEGADRSEPRRLGESCDRAGDCESSYCGAPRIGPRFPGICCNAACAGTCSWCDPSGTCVFVPDGQKPVGGFNCYVDAPGASCLYDGTCDGAGNCHHPAAGSPCGTGLSANACDGDNTALKVCDGRGACISTTPQSCAPYACRASTGKCWDYCETDAQCSGASCQPDGHCGFNSDTDAAVD